eukprot:4414649-Prymnesium_polylepis.2
MERAEAAAELQPELAPRVVVALQQVGERRGGTERDEHGADERTNQPAREARVVVLLGRDDERAPARRHATVQQPRDRARPHGALAQQRAFAARERARPKQAAVGGLDRAEPCAVVVGRRRIDPRHEASLRGVAAAATPERTRGTRPQARRGRQRLRITERDERRLVEAVRDGGRGEDRASFVEQRRDTATRRARATHDETALHGRSWVSGALHAAHTAHSPRGASARTRARAHSARAHILRLCDTDSSSSRSPPRCHWRSAAAHAARLRRRRSPACSLADRDAAQVGAIPWFVPRVPIAAQHALRGSSCERRHRRVPRHEQSVVVLVVHAQAAAAGAPQHPQPTTRSLHRVRQLLTARVECGGPADARRSGVSDADVVASRAADVHGKAAVRGRQAGEVRQQFRRTARRGHVGARGLRQKGGQRVVAARHGCRGEQRAGGVREVQHGSGVLEDLCQPTSSRVLSAVKYHTITVPATSTVPIARAITRTPRQPKAVTIGSESERREMLTRCFDSCAIRNGARCFWCSEEWIHEASRSRPMKLRPRRGKLARGGSPIFARRPPQLAIDACFSAPGGCDGTSSTVD